MREINTIEVDRYEPSERKGLMKHVGMIGAQEAFDALEKHLTAANLLPDEYFSANKWDWKDGQELPNYHKASCDVNWGGSEGIYLDIALLYRDENQHLQRFNFATGKTLGESGNDFLRMSRIAAECSMMLNGRGEKVRFYDEPQKDGIEVELNNQMIVRVHQKNKDIFTELVDTDGEMLQSAKIDDQDMFEFLRGELYKDKKEYENVRLTEYEKSLVVKALDFYGDRVADTMGYPEGEEYWDLKAKFGSVENNQIEKTPEEKLIEAVANYGLEYSWTDNDVIDTLVEMGITKEDFVKCGKSDFVKEYFESDDKSEQQRMPLDSVIQEAKGKQQAALEEVAEFLSTIKGDNVANFKKKYGITPDEILSNSSLLMQVVAEKQRLGANAETALYNVCLALQENKHADRLAELRKLKQER